MTCYICAPDDPNADEEGCADCDRRSDAYHHIVTNFTTGETWEEPLPRPLSAYEFTLPLGSSDG